MDNFDNLCKLLDNKKKNISNDDDEKKCLIIEKLFKDKGCFFKIDMETAIGILEYLGFNEDNILDTYFDLISPTNYEKNIPVERILFDDKVK